MEIDLVALARQKDMLTTPYVFDEDQARQMTEAGADIMVVHMGLTIGGTIGAETSMTLEEAITSVRRIASSALECREDVLVLCHGGPISSPDDAAAVLAACPECHGFYGASSMERLPTERALTEQIRAFGNIRGN